MDKLLSEITLDSTVSVKVDCVLNQQILAKNFSVIMDCLKHLKAEQDSHSASLKDLSSLKEMFEKLQSDFKDSANNSNNQQSNQNDRLSKKEQSSAEQGGNNFNKSETDQKSRQNGSKDEGSDQDSRQKGGSDQSQMMKEFEDLKRRVSKNEGSINGNTQDINVLLKDMKEAKDEIQSLKKLLSAKGSNDHQSALSGDRQLSENKNLNAESIKDLNKELLSSKNSIKDLEHQMAEMKAKMEALEKELALLKDSSNGGPSSNDHSSSVVQNTQLQQSNPNAKDISDILRRIESLNKKVASVEDQTNSNTQSINALQQQQQSTNKEVVEHKDDLETIHKEIEEINRALEKLSNIHNDDNNNLMSEIERLREEIMKMLESLQENSNGASMGTRANKTTYGQGLRRRSDSSQSNNDLNGKISELNMRLNMLEKMLNSGGIGRGGDDHLNNPEKLPMINRKAKREVNSSSNNNNQAQHKKDLSDLKHELELWAKNYLVGERQKSSGSSNASFQDWELKLQEIKNALNKKADHEGMKKGLAFLENKITQLHLFLTEPDSEDAMIVRKGFNCLSCSKKVENLRAKLGPRMNWDHLQSTNYNAHTPPKVGFPKYNDSNERDTN